MTHTLCKYLVSDNNFMYGIAPITVHRHGKCENSPDAQIWSNSGLS